jgi:hypothetical protein
MSSGEEIQRSLTADGRVPLEYCFLWYGCVCSWEPGEGAVFFHRIEDNLLFAACQEFLRSRGASLSESGGDPDAPARCRRLEALARYAEQHKWPQLKALSAWIEEWRQHFQDTARAEQGV